MALVNMCMSVTDTLMAAALGIEALAAAGVVSDLYSIAFHLAIGVIGGLSPLYAAAHAAGDRQQLSRLRASGWAVAQIFGLSMACVVWTAPGWLGGLGIEPVLLDRGEGYARAIALTFLPMIAAGVLRTRLVAAERAGALVRVTLAAVPLNAGLNAVLMFGVGGWPGLGLTGAGISSFLVACVTLAVFVRLARRSGDTGAPEAPDRVTVAEILRLGVPIGIATLSEVSVFLGATLFVAALSVAGAAAHVLAIRVAGVTFAVSIGLLQATTVRMARAEADPARQRLIARTSLRISGIAALLVAAAVGLTAWPLSLTLSGEAAGIAATLLLFVAASELAGTPGAAAIGLLRGLGITRLPMAITLLGNWLIAAPVGVVLATAGGLGATGMWIGLAAGSATASALTLLHLRRTLRHQTA
jgi:MATE family multidrug resistance protein